jgi:hypothetical protein
LTWIRLLSACRVLQLSGILEVTQGRRTRALSVVIGRPVRFDSDLPEDDLSHTLVASGMVPRDRVNWLKGRLSAGESLQGALVQSGAIKQDQLAAHLRDRLRRGVLAPLLWGSGTWRFSHRPLRGDRIDPRLLPDLPALGVLAEEIGTHVSLDAAMGDLGAIGPMLPGSRLDQLFPDLGLPPELQDLPEALADGLPVTALLGRYPTHARELVLILWLMSAAGLIAHPARNEEELEEALRRAGDGRPVEAPAAPAAAPRAPKPAAASRATSASRAAASRPAKSPSKPAASPPKRAARSAPASRTAAASKPAGKRSTRGAVPVATVQRMLRTDHEERLGLGEHAFLDLGPDADVPTIKRACTRLARRWKLAERDPRLPAASRVQARDLLRKLGEVRKSLMEFHARQPSGPAPEPEAASAPGAAARAVLATGDHRKALSMLQVLRRKYPSEPGVLADLGWAIWHVRGRDEKGVEEAEDYLRLALTFDSRNATAAERLARIAIARKDEDATRRGLARLIKIQPSATWAKKALSDLGPAGKNEAQGVGGWFRKGRS